MTNAAHEPTRASRLSRWSGTAPAWLAVLLLAQVAFGLLRFPQGSVRKRGEAIEAARAAGPLWHFPHADGETKRLVAWLARAAPADQAVVYAGRAAA